MSKREVLIKIEIFSDGEKFTAFKLDFDGEIVSGKILPDLSVVTESPTTLRRSFVEELVESAL